MSSVLDPFHVVKLANKAVEKGVEDSGVEKVL